MNQTIDSVKFRAAAKEGLTGGFLFYGEEEYLKHFCLKTARNAVVPDVNDSFNRIRFDSDNYSLAALEDAIISPPVFAEQKIIELHGAELSKLKDKDLEAFCAVLELLSDSPETVLVVYTSPAEFDPGLPKRPTATFKALADRLTPVYFEKQSGEKLVKWIGGHFAHNKINVTPDLCRTLMARCGQDMYALSSEIEKLCAYVASKNRSELTKEDIDLLASKHKEIGEFDFSNAILNRDCDLAFYILSDKEAKDKAGNDVGLILGSMISIYSAMYRVALCLEEGLSITEAATALKLNEYRCKLYSRALSGRKKEDIAHLLKLCEEADMLLKKGAAKGYCVLSRLIIEAANG